MSHDLALRTASVTQATEAAADTILEAAKAIQAWLDRGAREPEAIAALTGRVNAIFQACSFQDLTGQRIRRAIRRLQQVETMLEGLVPGTVAPPAPLSEVRGTTPTAAVPAVPGPAQAEIDRLLGG